MFTLILTWNSQENRQDTAFKKEKEREADSTSLRRSEVGLYVSGEAVWPLGTLERSAAPSIDLLPHPLVTDHVFSVINAERCRGKEIK